MKKRLPTILISILVISGLMILFYPTLSEWLSDRIHRETTTNYDTAMAEMEQEEIQSKLEEAQKYNNSLNGQDIEDPFIPESGMVVPENYASVLDLGDGMIGYLKIPAIDVELPIYHGTDSEVLEKGVGHMEKTAFPIGGEGNHTVLTGHTALPGARLFSDLIDLKEGDVFYITVLNQTLAYEIDQIKVVEPSETSELIPVAQEDYVTLITCTPYAVNSHRLLVRGSRIPYLEELGEDTENETVSSYYSYSFIIAIAALMVVVFIAVTVFINKWLRRRTRQ